MAYTLLDAAYEMYYPKAEFAKNPFSKKKKPGMLKRARQVVLGKSKRGFLGRVAGVGLAGLAIKKGPGAMTGAMGGLKNYQKRNQGGAGSARMALNNLAGGR